MLKKIEYHYDDYGEQIDIADLKIYWDTNENVFRHKFYCTDCRKELHCHCFRYLHNIIETIESGYQCNKCFVLNTWNDEDEFALDVAKCVDKLHPSNFKNRVEIMQYLNAQDGNFENSEISEKCEEIANMIYEELFNELKSISDEDFKHISYEYEDWYDDGGYSCEI